MLRFFLNIFSIIIAVMMIYAYNNPLSNITIFIISILFSIMATKFSLELLFDLKSKNRLVNIIIVFSTFMVYFIEGILSSSNYFNDLLTVDFRLSILVFIFRLMYFISTIVFAYISYGSSYKKYKYLSYLQILAAILLYLEIISIYVPYIYVISLVIHIIFLKKVNENEIEN